MWISGASRPSSSRACSPSSGSSDSVSHPFSPAVSHGWRWLIAKRILVPLSRRERTEAVLPMVADPAHEIALEAEAFGADLIAMVTPKPRWLGPRLLGKAARRVLRRATAPVMLLRA